jgi:hypothetical protein
LNALSTAPAAKLHSRQQSPIRSHSMPPTTTAISDSIWTCLPWGSTTMPRTAWSTHPHLFENLMLTKDTRQVQGINKGLAIEGEGTFKFTITDNSGQCHTIQIPNSLYLPKLKKCLLLPQHWVQDVGDNQTWMGNFAHCCMLHWGNGFKNTIPFDTA